MKGWDVYLGGKLITKRWHDEETTAEEVREELIEEGFDPDIGVVDDTNRW